jgi:hypothetical protein
MPKITRIKLDDNSDDHYAILGIVSAEADYKVSQLLNKKLKLSLKNDKSIELPGSDGADLSFTRYSFSSAIHEIS